MGIAGHCWSHQSESFCLSAQDLNGMRNTGGYLIPVWLQGIRHCPQPFGYVSRKDGTHPPLEPDLEGYRWFCDGGHFVIICAAEDLWRRKYRDLALVARGGYHSRMCSAK